MYRPRNPSLGTFNFTCCKSYTNETAGQFQGRLSPAEATANERAATKLENLEKNLTMVQLKLFLDKSETILRQAKALDLPLYDSVVGLDLRHCPPVVTISKYTEYFCSEESRKGFEETRSKENVSCVYFSDIYNGIVDESGAVPNLQIHRLFPHSRIDG